MPSPAFPGLFFAFCAMVLLIFVSVSPPAWERIHFLQASAGGQTTVFGVLGECLSGGGQCTDRNVGYDLQVWGADNLNINTTNFHRLTRALILHPIAGFFALLSLIFGALATACASRFLTIMMALSALFGLLITIAAFVLDMVFWSLVKNKINDAGYSASYGNANWLTAGALGAFALSFCTSLCGAFGRFASGRFAGEKY
ncbi:hypothetical protein L198_06897 [Cryptococcus wingfieldii CBS 7118]|uniref:Pali-domain-containing protein n=1 Tax=Cryptococcus wingfieldii CBS 7118 TaxID=1295528 RepID=A0A1E3IGD7_9TREE|nr:hypothetical protein L198_06897 [Cryptococcus wingfieldii CBS 7118]ODN87674.1 hypothetical protein L198_06897 [Cryptococcus wingfieldii CBS 7118]